MSYNSSIPLATDKMLISVDQIRANFQATNQAFLENHNSLNGTFKGKHTFLNFREQSDHPLTTASQVALYTMQLAGDTYLFYKPSNNATAIVLSYPSLSTGALTTDPLVWKPQQYSFVAGSFVVYGGTITNAINNQVVVLAPATTLIYCNLTLIQKSISAAATAIAVVSGSSFTIKFSGLETTPQNFTYLAIGNP